MSEKKEKNKGKNIILTIFLIVFLIGILVAAFNIVIWFIDSKKTRTMINEVSKNVSVIREKDNSNQNELKENVLIKYVVDFENLRMTNADTVAWVKVLGTDIEYPVVKGTDNGYYLTHSFDRSYNIDGWVFADFRNKFDGTDRNTIVYGHNIKDKSMFNTLKNVIKPEWYENKTNHIVHFITPGEEGKYQVFAVYQLPAQNYDNKVNFYSDDDFIAYVNDAKNRSYYNFGVEVSASDKILTLSTCADDARYRIVLHAKKI